MHVCVQPCMYIISVLLLTTKGIHLHSSETLLFRMSFNQASNSLLVLSSSFRNKLPWPPHFKQLTLGLKHQHPEDVGLQFSSPASFLCSQMIYLVYTIRENLTQMYFNNSLPLNEMQEISFSLYLEIVPVSLHILYLTNASLN